MIVINLELLVHLLQVMVIMVYMELPVTIGVRVVLVLDVLEVMLIRMARFLPITQYGGPDGLPVGGIPQQQAWGPRLG